MTIQTAMEDASGVFADAEQKAGEIKADVRDRFSAAIDEIRELGHIGKLEAEATKGELDTLVTGFEASLYAIHERLKDRSVDLDLEQYLPALRDGGPR